MRGLIQQLGAEDPGLLLAIGIVIGGAIVIVWYQVLAAWDLANEHLDELIEEVAPHQDLTAEQRTLIERLRKPGTEELARRLKSSGPAR